MAGKSKKASIAKGKDASKIKLISLIPAALGMFLLLSLAVSDSAKAVCLIAMFAGFIIVLCKYKVLRERFSRTGLILMLYCVMIGVSAFYAPSGKFALTESIKYFAAFAVFIAVTAHEPGDKEKAGLCTGLVIAVVTAFISFLSIDLTSAKLISTVVANIFSTVCPFYSELTIENIVRIASFYQNVNIFSGLAGIGILLCLGLLQAVDEKPMRRVLFSCLCINSIAFVTSFSRGAMAILGIVFILYLVLERGNSRAKALTVMLEALVFAGIASLICFAVNFGQNTGTRFIPVLASIILTAAMVFFDEYVGIKICGIFSAHGKAMNVTLIAVLLVAVAAIAAMLLLTGSAYVLGTDDIYRAAYPSVGENTLAIESDGEVKVVITSVDEISAFTGASTLYEGPADGAEFFVPEDSEVVFFRFSSESGATIKKATYSGTTSGSIKLKYLLLPEKIASFIQGMFQTEDFLKRKVFWQDGITIWKSSPIFGNGVGAFENMSCTIQRCFYETKYVHNHYIQTLIDTGLVGLLLFCGALISAAVTLINAFRKKIQNPLLPALGAALVFMAFQAFTDVIFSSNFYLPAAFAVLALIPMCGEEKPFTVKLLRNGAVVFSCAFLLLWCILLCCNLRGRAIVENPTSENLIKASKVDFFERNDYLLSYVYYMSTEEEKTADDEAAMYSYLEKLEKVQSNTIPYYLAYCWFELGDNAHAFELLQRSTAYSKTDPTVWDQNFRLAAQYNDWSDEFIEHITELYNSLEEYNNTAPVPIVLEADVSEYVNQVIVVE